jgi:hypothetical protein
VLEPPEARGGYALGQSSVNPLTADAVTAELVKINFQQACLFVCLFVCLFACLFVCLFACAAVAAAVAAALDRNRPAVQQRTAPLRGPVRFGANAVRVVRCGPSLAAGSMEAIARGVGCVCRFVSSGRSRHASVLSGASRARLRSRLLQAGSDCQRSACVCEYSAEVGPHALGGSPSGICATGVYLCLPQSCIDRQCSKCIDDSTALGDFPMTNNRSSVANKIAFMREQEMSCFWSLSQVSTREYPYPLRLRRSRRHVRLSAIPPPTDRRTKRHHRDHARRDRREQRIGSGSVS